MSNAHPERLLELVERCILAFEREGQAGLDAALAAGGDLSEQAQEHIERLQKSGLLLPPEVPERIGPWHVRQRLGSGGMGTVYLAEQKEPIPRRAAVKVIRRGMDSHEILARFAVEQRALAMLDHRGIARILDAGQTRDGRPFLAMEYVPGVPILRYCDERQLDTQQRLRLFQMICDAVQHAHLKGLLHRDLKPSNILVVDREGRPEPVVIDFGVAKSVGQGLSTGTQLTLPGRLLGTPEYMSPEQATNEADVDTRTDVYSLGVVLYELLTSTLPHDSVALRTGDIAAVLRSSEPPTPSTRLTALGAEAEAIAARRRVSLGALRRTLRGDLDWIVMKAIDRDRNRRYGMPAELASDISHHLRNEPISAGAPTATQRLRKYCGRNRLQISVASIVCGALTFGLLSSMVFHRRAIASAKNATASLEAAMSAVGELVQVGDNDLVTVPHLEAVRRDLMQRAVAFYHDFLSRDSATDPRLVARTLDALVRLGNLQAQLGELDDAMARVDDVDALLASAAAQTLPESVRRAATVDALLDRAGIEDRRAQTETAIQLARRAIPLARQLVKDSPDRTTQLRLGRALSLCANLEATRAPLEAIEDIEQAIGIVTALDDDGHNPKDQWLLLRMRCDRANMLRISGRPDAALAAVAELRQSLGQQPDTQDWPILQAKLRMIGVLDGCERPSDALQLADEIEPGLTTLVDNHPSIVAYRLALMRMYTLRSSSRSMRMDLRGALDELRQECRIGEAGLALAPHEPQLLQATVIARANIATVHQNGRTNLPSWQWDEDEVNLALTAAMKMLDEMPAGEPRRESRLIRSEVLQLRATFDESRGELDKAITQLQEAAQLVSELASDAPTTIEYRTRQNELQRHQASVLLSLGRPEEAGPLVEAALVANSELAATTDAKERWRDRRRDLLLLHMRVAGATGQIDRACAALDEYERIGDTMNEEGMDWLGRQEAARAVAVLLTAMPAQAEGRERLHARGRALVEAALSYKAKTLSFGSGHGTVAIMTGNTLQVACQLEDAAGDKSAAARRAGEAVESYAIAWQARPSERGEQRVRGAADAWLRYLTEAGDLPALTLAAARLCDLMRDQQASLGELAATAASLSAGPIGSPLAAELRARSIALLRAALAAGMPTSSLAEPRFAPLARESEFLALMRQ